MNSSLKLILNYITDDGVIITKLEFTSLYMAISIRFDIGDIRRIFISLSNCYFENNEQFTNYVFNEFVSEYELIRRNLNWL